MTDKRQEYRIQSQDIVVFLELESLAHGGRRELLCGVGDISANGLRIYTDQTFIVGTICTLRIRLPDHNREFLLVGEVMWCRSHSASDVQLGIEILPSEQTDIVAWKHEIVQQIS